MRKPIAVVLLCAAVLSAAVPGSAATVRLGLCSFTGIAAFDAPVTLDLAVNALVFTGDLQCAGMTGIVAGPPEPPNPTLAEENFTGTVEVVGEGNLSCLLTNIRGSLTAIVPTGAGTRDVWNGSVSVVGSLQSAILGTISQVEHQSFDAESGEWVTTTADSPGTSIVAGALTPALSQEDLGTCQEGGVSSLPSSGTAAFAYSL
ncbi:MAG: hypothetical protein ACRDJM_05045 [Actinomycetota bacterium]